MTTKPKGVMIKGMDMPTRCILCPFVRHNKMDEFYCIFKNGMPLCRGYLFYERPPWCLLEEVK